MFEEKRITIRADLVSLYEKKYGNGSDSPSITKVVNIIFEKSLTGRLLELSDENFQSIQKIAEHFHCSNDEALNIALGSVEFELKVTHKAKITLDRSEKVMVKRGKSNQINPITRY